VGYQEFFSGAIAGERSVFGKQLVRLLNSCFYFILFCLPLCWFPMEALLKARKHTKDALDKYFHILTHPEERKKKEKPPLIIPTTVVKDMMSDPFTRDEIQVPSDHL
jgi:hypothetical protein